MSPLLQVRTITEILTDSTQLLERLWVGCARAIRAKFSALKTRPRKFVFFRRGIHINKINKNFIKMPLFREWFDYYLTGFYLVTLNALQKKLTVNIS